MTKFVNLFLAVLLVASCSKESTSDLTIVTDDGEVSYTVENAQTNAELEQGLMFRESLAPNAGMIFDLSKAENAVMWMKNTKIPLDMIFIDQDGTIAWIYENAEPESTNLIISPLPATAVLEVNGGDVQKHNIKIGDIVKHKFLKNSSKASKPAETTVDQETAPAEEAVVEESDDVLIQDEPVVPAGTMDNGDSAPAAPEANSAEEVPAEEEVSTPEGNAAE